MFEFHGWATIRFTSENRDRDDEDALQADAVEKVRAHVQQLEQLGWDHPRGNQLLDFRYLNGDAQLWASGYKNHASTVKPDLLDLFQHIARVAPGSYGLLYTLDDEDQAHNNEFRVYVLARGVFVERSDPFLSPFVPVVEDPYSES